MGGLLNHRQPLLCLPSPVFAALSHPRLRRVLIPLPWMDSCPPSSPHQDAHTRALTRPHAHTRCPSPVSTIAVPPARFRVPLAMDGHGMACAWPSPFRPLWGLSLDFLILPQPRYSTRPGAPVQDRELDQEPPDTWRQGSIFSVPVFLSLALFPLPASLSCASLSTQLLANIHMPPGRWMTLHLADSVPE